MFKIRLVPDFNDCWKWLSVQLSLLLVLLVMLEPHLPLLTDYLPEKYHAIIGILIVIGRVIDQEKKQNG